MTPALDISADRLRDWVVERALPFWAKTARREDGSWVEHLKLDGSADISAERRWRVLARQVYVYAEAARQGWYDGADIAETTYAKMMETGYVHRVDADGSITNDRRDLYDHAFYLLASASLYRLTQNNTYLADAENILAMLDRVFGHHHSGFKETPKGELPRRQNPHMHILEASLYLYGGTQNLSHLRYAQDAFNLFEHHFFDPKNHVIREFFDEDWTIIAGDKGQTAEPGHAMEWVWLLAEYQKAAGTSTATYAKALYGRAQKGRDWFLNDEEDIFGEIRRESKRLWVQTEVIKAHLAQAERGTPGAADMAAAVINAMFGTYLMPDGTWQDQLNACGANVAATIPVSTFYHILCMAVEAKRVAKLV